MWNYTELMPVPHTPPADTLAQLGNHLLWLLHTADELAHDRSTQGEPNRQYRLRKYLDELDLLGTLGLTITATSNDGCASGIYCRCELEPTRIHVNDEGTLHVVSVGPSLELTVEHLPAEAAWGVF